MSPFTRNWHATFGRRRRGSIFFSFILDRKTEIAAAKHKMFSYLPHTTACALHTNIYTQIKIVLLEISETFLLVRKNCNGSAACENSKNKKNKH